MHVNSLWIFFVQNMQKLLKVVDHSYQHAV